VNKKKKLLKSRSHIIKITSETWDKVECFLNDNYDDYSVHIVLKGAGEFEYDDMKEAFAGIEEHMDNIDFIKISADCEQEHFTLHFVNSPNYVGALLYADLQHTNKTENVARQFVKELIKDTEAAKKTDSVFLGLAVIICWLFDFLMESQERLALEAAIYFVLLCFVIIVADSMETKRSLILGKPYIQFYTDKNKAKKYDRINRTIKIVNIVLRVMAFLLYAALIVLKFL